MSVSLSNHLSRSWGIYSLAAVVFLSLPKPKPETSEELCSKGSIELHAHHPQEAVSRFEKAAEIFTNKDHATLTDIESLQLCSIYEHLSDAYALNGEPNKALSTITMMIDQSNLPVVKSAPETEERLSSTILAKLSDLHMLHTTQALHATLNLAEAEVAQRQIEPAKKSYDSAINIASQLSDSELADDAKFKLAALMGESPSEQRKSRKLYEEFYKSKITKKQSSEQLVKAMQALVAIYSNAEAYQLEKAVLAQLRIIYEKSTPPFVEGLAWCDCMRGNLHQALSENDLAASFYAQAMDEYKASQGPLGPQTLYCSSKLEEIQVLQMQAAAKSSENVVDQVAPSPNQSPNSTERESSSDTSPNKPAITNATEQQTKLKEAADLLTNSKAPYVNNHILHGIRSNKDGKYLTLDDASSWEIADGDVQQAQSWFLSPNVTIMPNSREDFPYRIVKEDGSNFVEARFLHQ